MPTRVPKSTPEFNTYLLSTDNFLQAISSGTTHNWERLELSQQNADDWHSQRTAWVTLYEKFQDPTQHTSIITAEVQTFKQNFKTFSTNILDKIAGSDNATDQDAAVFNVVLAGKQAKPSHPTTPIVEQCFATVQPLGGASYKFTFRTGTDTGRASLAPGANGVILAVQIGGTAPQSAEDIGEKNLLTKASYVAQLGTGNIGQKLYIACRWYNTHYPDFAGPWSNIQVFSIG